MKKSKILIVEDEIIIAREIEEQLQQLGYQVIGIAATGEEVIDLVKERSPDLILMDIVIKGKMDGIETGEAIRKHFNIPIVYVTAHADENTINRAKFTQPSGFIVKPFSEKDLQSNIEIALYKHQETALKKTEPWFISALKYKLEPSLAIDRNGKIIFANDAAISELGYSAEELKNAEFADILKKHGSQNSNFFEAFNNEFVREIEITFFSEKIYLLNQSQTDRFIENVMESLKKNQNNIIGAIITFRPKK